MKTKSIPITSMMFQNIIIRRDGILLGVIGIPPFGGWLGWRYKDHLERHFNSKRKAKAFVREGLEP